jgi:hypothetical protein
MEDEIPRGGRRGAAAARWCGGGSTNRCLWTGVRGRVGVVITDERVLALAPRSGGWPGRQRARRAVGARRRARRSRCRDRAAAARARLPRHRRPLRAGAARPERGPARTAGRRERGRARDQPPGDRAVSRSRRVLRVPPAGQGADPRDLGAIDPGHDPDRSARARVPGADRDLGERRDSRARYQGATIAW